VSRDGWLERNGSPVAEVGNYTHNVGHMWHLAVSESGPLPDLDATDGMRGAEALPHLAAAVAWMIANAEQLRPLEPENGWGDLRGAVAYLVGAALACSEHPDAVLRWDV